MHALGVRAAVCALAVAGLLAVPATASATRKKETRTYTVRLHRRAPHRAGAASAVGLVNCTLSITFSGAFDQEEAAGFNACSVPMTRAVLAVQVGFGAPDYVSPSPDSLPDVFAVFNESQWAGPGIHSVQACIHVALAAGDEIGSAAACLPRVRIGGL